MGPRQDNFQFTFEDENGDIHKCIAFCEIDLDISVESIESDTLPKEFYDDAMDLAQRIVNDNEHDMEIGGCVDYWDYYGCPRIL